MEVMILQPVNALQQPAATSADRAGTASVMKMRTGVFARKTATRYAQIPTAGRTIT
ncbi:MAG: DUF680 domain-containing protein [Candidatus Aenigmarchaeota archaeon]|nr:DUF680 domain-containing protein [Candidatus Aenigmarchaeota archaeon]